MKQYNQKNGVSYAIDHVIQAPQKSVYSVLGEYSQFDEFNKLCNGYNEDLFFFASDKMKEVNQVTKKQRVKGYELFVNEVGHFGLDYDVKFFNSYNYTVYVPDNEAMKKAYALGLPTWSDVQAIYDEYHEKWEEQQTEGNYSEDVIAARNKALAMLEEINAFIRYHFQDNSVYLDKNIEAGVYATACSDTLGVREKLTVSGANRQITVVDKSGQQVNISSTGSNVVNKMTRDYVFDKAAKTAGEIRTSSFAVIHQIPVALNSHAGTNRYDTLWTGANAKKKLAAFRRLYDSKLYKQY